MNDRVLHILSRLPQVALGVAAILAAICVAMEYGFEPPPVPLVVLHAIQFCAVSLYAACRISGIARAAKPWSALAKHGAELSIAAVALALAVFWHVQWMHVLLAATIYVVIIQAGSLFSVGLGRLYGQPGRPSARLHPARLMLTSFLVLIVVGGLLLSLPRAVSPEIRQETGHYADARVLKCFFTATSAACVTGLVVYDTSSDFTRFGQVVILLLMQLGGLGIMVFGSVFGVMLRRQLSLRESLLLQDVYSHQTIGEIGKLVKFICIATLVIEGVGAVMLYDLWPAEISDPATRWFYSAFHAVSAFCNAGFTLSTDSLISYRHAWPIYAVIMPTIVLGGLGFPVLAELGRLCFDRARRVIRRRADIRTTIARLSLHSKLVLLMSAMLIVLPAGLIFLFESSAQSGSVSSPDSAMHSMPWAERLLAALFQSVTSRTAGFNTASLAVDDLSNPSLFLLCILMFVGGSPASTAGGVKTVAIVLLILGTISTLRQREHVEAFKRRIPNHAIRQAAVLVTVMFSLVSLVVLVLSYTESASLAEVLFEAVSACGTVGLSTGLTAHLTTPGKVVIMLAMFAGRLGPLTLLIALAGRQRTTAYDYPVEHITIG